MPRTHKLKSTPRQQPTTDRAVTAAKICTTAPTVMFTAGLGSAGLHHCRQLSGNNAMLMRLLCSTVALSTAVAFESSAWQA